MVSAAYFEAIILNIMAKVPAAKWAFLEREGAILTECNHEFPNIYFLYEGFWIEASAKDYLFAVDDAQVECVFFIFPQDAPINVIGMPAFVDYYTIHDPVTGNVGFVPHSTSMKETL